LSVLDTIFGLPLHPLIVHATVVVVPTAAVAVLLAAVWPRFRRWAGPLPLALALVALVLDPLSTQSGEQLESHVGSNPLVERHSQLADGLLPWVIALVVGAAAAYWFHRRSERLAGYRGRSLRWLPAAAAAVAVVAALGTGVQVVLIGHSGAQAAWSGVASQHASGGGS
jgi:hypothetical protein